MKLVKKYAAIIASKLTIARALLIASLISARCFCSFGQDTATIEKTLFKYYSKLQYVTSTIDKPGWQDSIALADSIFKAKLLYYSGKVPATLIQSFNSLKNKGFTVSTSTDGLFRIYNWDNESGGTMRFYDNVFQFKNGNKVISGILPYCYQYEDGDPGCSYSDTIYTVKGSNKIYYAAIYGTVGSSKVSGEGVKFFAIENNKINDTVHLVKTKSHLSTHIDYELDNNSYGSQHSIGDGTILYDRKTNTIYIPLIWDDGTITKDYIKYRFNGKYFEKTKEG
jgi:hypothetical protein